MEITETRQLVPEKGKWTSEFSSILYYFCIRPNGSIPVDGNKKMGCSSGNRMVGKMMKDNRDPIGTGSETDFETRFQLDTVLKSNEREKTEQPRQ